MSIKDKYVFEVTLDDTNDEFSKNFNPKDQDQVLAFEENIKDGLEEMGFEVLQIRLKRVTVDLN